MWIYLFRIIFFCTMVAQLFCLTSGSGMPLFIRKKSDKDQVSFAQIASINGVYMFAKSHGVKMKNVILQDSVVCWKDFHDCIMLIGVATGVTTAMMEQFLDTVFNAMVLAVGIEELTSVKNAERLKRELRVTYRVIDKLLDGLECAEKTQSVRGASLPSRSSSSDIGNFVETILCQENQALLNCLENYMDVVESAYGCVSIHGRLAVATQSWWELSSEEKRLLAVLVSVANSHCSSSDIPVFLPVKSPSVPFRLVSLRLVNGVDVCALCGPNPPLGEIEQSALQIWRPIVDILRSAEKTYPRNFPVSLELDGNVLGVLLIDINVGKFLITRNLSTKESCSLSGSHRQNVLRTFFNQSASVFLLPKDKTTDQGIGKETYWCSEYHKCHGMRDRDNVICVLYAASVPSHTMRLITKQCLKTLTGDKHAVW